MAVTNTSIPVITGQATQGQLLQTSNGTWTYDLDYLEYTYRWLRCDVAGINCVAIGGATSASYLLQQADVGSRLRSEVTATETDTPPPPDPPPDPGAHVTGTHWPNVSEFGTLASIGYDFAIITVNPNNPAAWTQALDAAEAAGIQLIIGGYPYPYTYSGGVWTISAAGTSMLNYFESREELIIALFVYNEPYWVLNLSGDQLRALSTKIKTVWPTAKIYHDQGAEEAVEPT